MKQRLRLWEKSKGNYGIRFEVCLVFFSILLIYAKYEKLKEATNENYRGLPYAHYI